MSADALLGPITGPSAWYGPDLAKCDDWIVAPNELQLDEIERAMRPLVEREADIARITEADFPLPTLAPVLADIRAELLDGRGFALLRGLPVERYSMREAACAFYGIGAHLGHARSQNAMGHVLGHVVDLGLDVADTSVRVYQTTARQTFHTDSCDVVGLLCLQTAKQGGLSSVTSSMTVFNEMRTRRPDLLRLLFEPFATDRRGEVPAGKKPYFEIPVFHYFDGRMSAIYARRYIESARRFDDVPPLTPEQIAALDLLDELANSPDLRLDMELQPGDVQFVHNHTLLHDRTAYEDWPERKRHLLRLWLAVPGARALPQVYAERYGKVDIGDRGGIIVPGTLLNAPLEPV